MQIFKIWFGDRDYEAKVDDEDAYLLRDFRWHLGLGFDTFYVKSKTLGPLHRIIMQTPEGLVVDHIDWNGLNNQRNNLRNCTVQQNSWHSKPRRGRKYKGVTAFRGKFRATIDAGDSRMNLGTFETVEEAAWAYDYAAIELHGQYAYLNLLTLP